MSRTVVIGASVAGVRTVQALRRHGYAGEIVLVGDESELPYDKPPLSKAVLAGTRDVESTRLLTREQAAALDVELVLGVSAHSLDPAGARVRLGNGRALDYDDVVLATGARARPSPWGSPKGLHQLRSADNCRALSADLGRAEHLVVIGGGFIGGEVASTAVQRGIAVTMVDPVDPPTTPLVGREVATRLAALHAAHAVDIRFGVGVQHVQQAGDRLVVMLGDGARLETDVAVVGIGAVPNVEWLADSGLSIDDGIICDEFCRAIGHGNVWAAGDAARWWHPREAMHRRIEHWSHACEQAAAVARNITSPDEMVCYDPVDYVWSDQYDWRIQIAGRTGGTRQSEIVGQPEENRFAALYWDEAGTLSGAVTVNWQKAMVIIRKLLLEGRPAIADARSAVTAAHQRAVVASA